MSKILLRYDLGYCNLECDCGNSVEFNGNDGFVECDCGKEYDISYINEIYEDVEEV